MYGPAPMRVVALCVLALLVSGSVGRAVELSIGDLLVSDETAGLLKVDPATGAQQLIAPGTSFGSAQGPAQSANGRILIADCDAAEIVEVEAASGDRKTLASGGSLLCPLDVDVDDQGTLFVADLGDGVANFARVLRIEPDGSQQTLLQALSDLEVFFGLTLWGGDLLVTRAVGPPHVLRVDPVTGNDTVVSSAPEIVLAAGIAKDALGNLWVTDLGVPGLIESAVFQLDPLTGAVSSNFWIGGPLNLPVGVTVADTGEVYVADGCAGAPLPGECGTGAVFRLDSLTTEPIVVSEGGSFENPFGVTVASVAVRSDCNDGLDNDGDQLIDHPADGGCQDAADPTEDRDCADGLDNDGDILVDYPADPGCRGLGGRMEDPECNDGKDNDGDGGIDFDGNPRDPDCGCASQASEEPAPSGNLFCGEGGGSLCLLVPVLRLMRRRASRATPPRR